MYGLERERLIRERRTVKLMVPEELQAELSAHGFCKWGTTEIFDVKIINPGMGYYLRMSHQKGT